MISDIYKITATVVMITARMLLHTWVEMNAICRATNRAFKSHINLLRVTPHFLRHSLLFCMPRVNMF